MQDIGDTADGPFSDHEAIADDALSISMADNTACYYMCRQPCMLLHVRALDVDEDTATTEYAEKRGHSHMCMQKNYEDTATSEYAEELRGHSHI